MASLLLLFAGYRWPNLATFDEILSRVVWPIQYMVDMPIHSIEQIQSFFQERSDLLAENENLKKQQIYLQAQVQKLRALEAENQELRVLLQSVGPNTDSFFEARLIHTDIDPFSNQILLNKGKQSGVEVGQVVIDQHGLVGVVIAANDQTSRVLLLTDAGFAVPVQSVRSGERAIATGSGNSGELRLNYVPPTADFVEGDQLVTSGLGGRFPAGYPVGVITSILQDPSTRFTLIGATPSAKLGQLRHVLLVKRQAVEVPVEGPMIDWEEVLAEQSTAPAATPAPVKSKVSAQQSTAKPNVPSTANKAPPSPQANAVEEEDEDDPSEGSAPEVTTVIATDEEGSE